MSERAAPRAGVQDLPHHLDDLYGVDVVETRELDLGTFQIALPAGRTWIARVHPPQRPPDQVRGDAEILAWLAHHDYPAERLPAGIEDLADGPPGAELGAAQALLDDVGAPDALHEALAAADDGDGLPTAFAHPDFVMANLVCDADRDGALVFVDWSGAGVAPARGRWRSCCGRLGPEATSRAWIVEWTDTGAGAGRSPPPSFTACPR